MELPSGTENSLTSKLENAIDSLDNDKDTAGVNQLEAFINQVEAQRGKKLTEEEADALIAAAQWIIDNVEDTDAENIVPDDQDKETDNEQNKDNNNKNKDKDKKKKK